MLASALALVGIGVSGATADEASEAFIQASADRVLGVLGDANLSAEERTAALAEAVDDIFDVEYISARVLGRAMWTNADEAVKGDFVAAYRDFVTSDYENYLEGYIGEALQVNGSRDGERGSFVNATITTPTDGQPLETEWVVWKISNDTSWGRVNPVEEGEFRVIDVTVTVGASDISLLTQQTEAGRAIREQNGGRLPEMIEDLRARTAAARGS